MGVLYTGLNCIPPKQFLSYINTYIFWYIYMYMYVPDSQ